MQICNGACVLACYLYNSECACHFMYKCIEENNIYMINSHFSSFQENFILKDLFNEILVTQ